MSYSAFDLSGGISHCHPFYERLLTCLKREALPLKMCNEEREDLMECYTRKK